MSKLLTCDEARAQELIERYVAQTLPPDLEREVELHYLACEACHEEVRLALAIRRNMLPRRLRSPRLSRYAPAVGLVTAAGLAGLLLLTRERVPPEIAALAEAEAPIYLGVPLRSSSTAADSIFELAMSAYTATEYERAVPELRRALEAGASPVPVQFFLGAAQLQLGRPAEAAAAFKAVLERGDSPYRREAHFYRAKALLQLGRVDDARAELRQIAGSQDIGAEATALLRRLEELQRR